MNQQAIHHFTESRYQITRGRLATARTIAAKALAVEPEAPLWLFVAGSIEAAQFWMARSDRPAALQALQRIFRFSGRYDFAALKPDMLQALPAELAEQHLAAALDHLTQAGQLANDSAEPELIDQISATARELDSSWAREAAAPSPLIADELCLLDISIEQAPGVAWVNDLPRCPLVMMSPHWLRFTSAKANPVARKLRDALVATRRFRQQALPEDLGSSADPVLDQLWRRGSECDLIIVTGNVAQVRAAEGLRKLSDELADPQQAPIRRKLRLVRPAARLPDWQVPNKHETAMPAAALPRLNGKAAPTLFSLRADHRVHLDLTPVDVAPVGTGSVVRTGSNDYRRLVSKQLGFGGEGTVYLTDAGEVCKAYQPGKATVATVRKLQLMTSKPLGHPLVCWPTELVYQGDRFVGYLMPRAQGQIMRAVTNPEKILTVFPGWTRRDLAALAAKVCAVVEYLHRNNILVGDLSDTNIIVDQLGQPWFIDTDSYQFGGYPSPVGRRPFIHPDLLGQDLKDMFRRLEHEWFALATLVFMILFPGRPPYAGAGADNPDDDHHDRVFPYRINKVGDPRLDRRDVQLGAPWAFIWSNLPDDIRRAFWAIFRECRESSAAPPYDATFWRKTLEAYAHDKNPQLSNELFPTRYRLTKPKPDEERRICERCGHEFNAPKTVSDGRLSEHRQRKLKFCGTCLNTLLSFPCEIVRPNGKPCKMKYLVKFRDLDDNGRKFCAFHQTNPP